MKQLFKKYSIVLFILLLISSSFIKTEAITSVSTDQRPTSVCESGYHWEYSLNNTYLLASVLLAQSPTYSWQCVPDNIVIPVINTTPVVDPYADRTVETNGPFTLTTNLSVVNNTVGQVNIKPTINVSYDNTWDVNNLAQSAVNLNSPDYRQYVTTPRLIILDWYNKKDSWDNTMTDWSLTPIQQGWLSITDTSIQSLDNHTFPDGGYQAPYVSADGIKIKIIDSNGNTVNTDNATASATYNNLTSLNGLSGLISLSSVNNNEIMGSIDTPSNISNLPTGNYKAVITASPFISVIEEKCADKWYKSAFGVRICGWTGINGRIDRLNLEPHYPLQTVIPFSIKAYQAPTCSDGIQNQDETGIDLGGVCKKIIFRVSKVSSPDTEILQDSLRKTTEAIKSETPILVRYIPNGLPFPYTCTEPSGTIKTINTINDINDMNLSFKAYPQITSNYSVTCISKISNSSFPITNYGQIKTSFNLDKISCSSKVDCIFSMNILDQFDPSRSSGSTYTAGINMNDPANVTHYTEYCIAPKNPTILRAFVGSDSAGLIKQEDVSVNVIGEGYVKGSHSFNLNTMNPGIYYLEVDTPVYRPSQHDASPTSTIDYTLKDKVYFTIK